MHAYTWGRLIGHIYKQNIMQKAGSPEDSTQPEACPSAGVADLCFFLLAPGFDCKLFSEAAFSAGPSALGLTFCLVDAPCLPCLPALAGSSFLAACCSALLTSYSSCLFLACVSDNAPDHTRVTAMR